MKKDIHPELFDVLVSCTCGYSFETTSTEPSIRTTLCSHCHPFYTGAQKYVDTAGRIEKFEKKFGKKKK
ncbi:MAG: 50S ribosomal protein L31 [Gammaproteobacteria bacterium RIFCSPHIGHO2_12_FULL_37_14]|nr:MAG: 50S ribosomal protein L31 [Gammaproteobacteria bacterium RIFCSPHIGHO2_12_FULL_37_14]